MDRLSKDQLRIVAKKECPLQAVMTSAPADSSFLVKAGELITPPTCAYGPSLTFSHRWMLGEDWWANVSACPSDRFSVKDFSERFRFLEPDGHCHLR